MSVFVVNNWSSATTYNLNDIVRHPADSNTYYYSQINGNLNNTPSATSTQWGGIGSYNGISKPLFIWKASYPTSFQNEPLTTFIQFGQGYSQRIPEKINNNLVKMNVIFDNRTSKEAEAIDHFLRSRNSAESFLFTPPGIYGLQKLFLCKTWTTDYIFKDNYTIRAMFDEAVN